MISVSKCRWHGLYSVTETSQFLKFVCFQKLTVTISIFLVLIVYGNAVMIIIRNFYYVGNGSPVFFIGFFSVSGVRISRVLQNIRARPIMGTLKNQISIWVRFCLLVYGTD